MKIYLVTIILAFTQCSDPIKGGETISESNIDSININAGKNWIKSKVESYFNNDSLFLKGFSSLCTKQYAEFKQDAISIEYDGMTENEFKAKWGRRYSKYAGIGDGFMIAGTNYGKILITKCEFKNRTEMGNYLYDVVITDTVFNSTFVRQIILNKTRDSFLIDNVLELTNDFKENNTTPNKSK